MTSYRFGTASPTDLSALPSLPSFLFYATIPAGQYTPGMGPVIGSTKAGKIAFQDFTSGTTLAEFEYGSTGLRNPTTITLARASVIAIAITELTSGAGIDGTLSFATLTDVAVPTRSYSMWKNDVLSFAERPDLVSDIDIILRPVQAMLARTLNVREAETSIEITTSGNAATLPPDYKDIRAVTHNGRPLVYVGPELFYAHPFVKVEDGFSDQTVYQGQSLSVFTVQGNTLLVAPEPSEAQTLRLIYYGAPVELVADDDTHEYLENAYDVYLYAGLSGLYDYTAEPRLKMLAMRDYQQRLSSFNAQGSRSRTGTLISTGMPRPGMIV